jgi:hypothetical protein
MEKDVERTDKKQKEETGLKVWEKRKGWNLSSHLLSLIRGHIRRRRQSGFPICNKSSCEMNSLS